MQLGVVVHSVAHLQARLLLGVDLGNLRAGDLVLFPPWLGHAVTAAPSALADADGPRISISFNYAGDDALEEGRHAWGQVTAGLDALALEEGLHLQAEGAESG